MVLQIREKPARYGPETRPDLTGGEDKASIPESLLARLWRQRAARRAWFRTAAGSRVRVIYPGREGKAWGPDFRDALLEFEGQGLVRGDVELHVRQRDWHGHGHSQDPNYNGVVLHAALEVDSPSTGLHNGENVPVVSLAPLLDAPIDSIDEPGQSSPEIESSADSRISQDLWDLLEARGYPRPTTAAEAGDLLDRAGDRRFRSKSRLFVRLLEEESPGQVPKDQLLFEGLMEGLGYQANKQAFVSLARRAPWFRLVELSKGSSWGMADSAALCRVAGLLSAVSGLGPGSSKPGSLPVEKLPRGLGPPLSVGNWHLSGLRPANHPLRRMAGAAGLVLRFGETGLTDGLAEVCDRGRPVDLTQALTVEAEGHRPAYIGRDRARDLAVNVVLPYLAAIDQGAGDHASATGGFLEIYRSFGKLQENGVTEEMSRRLLNPGWRCVVNSARRQQGLILLHRLLAGVG